MGDLQDPTPSQLILDQAQQLTQDSTQETYQQAVSAGNPYNSTNEGQLEDLHSDSYYQTLLTTPPAPPILVMDKGSVPEQIDQGEAPPLAILLPHVPDDITSQPQPPCDSVLPNSAELYSYTLPPTIFPVLKMIHKKQPDPNP